MSVYEIRVKGHLDPRWSEWFDGLQITNEPNGEALLSGYIADQATLHGVLAKVRDLNLQLISVTGVDSDQPDSHDLIRVHGARENNLKDVGVEIPKRRLTVFTGVSGSGKSSLVFGTIAAESQRLINETYSAFVQGFMPNLSRPEVDVLKGLTTAIIVDQERMGANARSTVGTATDANAMLRILFSRLGQPHKIGRAHV